MHSLFELNKTELSLNPLVLSIKEFEKIWKRDKTKGKLKAIKELTYIYAMSSSQEDNIWKDYMNLDERSKLIIIDLFGDELSWTPDRLITNALSKYKDRIPKTPSELLLETLQKSMIKIKDWLDEIDLSDVDNQGRLLYNPKNIIDIAKKATDQYMEIEETIEKIQSKKRLSIDKIKGGGSEGLFEDGDAMTNLE